MLETNTLPAEERHDESMHMICRDRLNLSNRLIAQLVVFIVILLALWLQSQWGNG